MGGDIKAKEWGRGANCACAACEACPATPATSERSWSLIETERSSPIERRCPTIVLRCGCDIARIENERGDEKSPTA